MTTQEDDNRARELRNGLASELTDAGVIRSEQWRTAFAEVPRHLLVPEPAYLNVDGSWIAVDSADPRWLDLVYSDTTLVTQLDHGRPPQPGRPESPTSSTTAPKLMALMLHALDVLDDHRVMEIGTGTGYNAALLSHRVGSEHVTTIEIDPVLAAGAKARLADAGYTPAVIVGDGADGEPGGRPHHRIIATCSVPAIPPAWLDQSGPGTVIVANVSKGLNSGALARLVVNRDGAAEGRLLAAFGSFMPTRTISRPGQEHDLLTAALRQAPVIRRTTLTSPEVIHQPDFALLVDLLTDVRELQWFTPDATAELQTWLLGLDGSWACVAPKTGGGWLVEEGGPRRLWDQVESAYRLWNQLGRPGRQRFGLSVTRTDHTLWLDAPNSGQVWSLSAG